MAFPRSRCPRLGSPLDLGSPAPPRRRARCHMAFPRWVPPWIWEAPPRTRAHCHMAFPRSRCPRLGSPLDLGSPAPPRRRAHCHMAFPRSRCPRLGSPLDLGSPAPPRRRAHCHMAFPRSRCPRLGSPLDLGSPAPPRTRVHCHIGFPSQPWSSPGFPLGFGEPNLAAHTRSLPHGFSSQPLSSPGFPLGFGEPSPAAHTRSLPHGFVLATVVLAWVPLGFGQPSLAETHGDFRMFCLVAVVFELRFDLKTQLHCRLFPFGLNSQAFKLCEFRKYPLKTSQEKTQTHSKAKSPEAVRRKPSTDPSALASGCFNESCGFGINTNLEILLAHGQYMNSSKGTIWEGFGSM